MFLGMFGISLRCFLSLLPLGLPGGNQVDGLPPAASVGVWGGGVDSSLVSLLWFEIVSLVSVHRLFGYRMRCEYGHLRPTVNRQPGYRRGDREVVVTKFVYN